MQYNSILLRDYFEIAQDGCYGKLLMQGVATPTECKEQWNKIVAESYEANNNQFDFANYIDTLEGFNHFLQEHNTVTAQLIILHFQVDADIISELVEKGYKIDTSGKRVYFESLINAVKRSKHLLSTIKIKANEMSVYDKLAESKPTSFDEIMALLILNLGFTVSDEITLARYNHYRRFIEEKHKQSAA